MREIFEIITETIQDLKDYEELRMDAMYGFICGVLFYLIYYNTVSVFF
jgi:hypothetical protein